MPALPLSCTVPSWPLKLVTVLRGALSPASVSGSEPSCIPGCKPASTLGAAAAGSAPCSWSVLIWACRAESCESCAGTPCGALTKDAAAGLMREPCCGAVI
eukprot:3580466-Prymnesium_polylepis.1